MSNLQKVSPAWTRRVGWVKEGAQCQRHRWAGACDPDVT